MKELKVKTGDTLTIRVKVTRVSENALNDQIVTIIVGGQPNTVMLKLLDVVGKD